MARAFEVDTDDPVIRRFMRKDDRQVRYFLKSIGCSRAQIAFAIGRCEDNAMDGIAYKVGRNWLCNGDELREWLEGHPLP